MTSSLPYRACVGIMLINHQGLVFIGQRKGGAEHVDHLHSWQMPQGGIEDGEDPLDAAKRELYEETNVSSITVLKQASKPYHYDIPEHILKENWSGRYKGQIQTWFALRFDGQEQEINIHSPAHGAHKPEFINYRWETCEALPSLIIPFKRPVYEAVVQEFLPLTKQMQP
jgi:putative (di)nucleoside polyphosphate hydrolase